MLTSRDEVKEIRISDSCLLKEHYGNDNLGLAVAYINGEHPSKSEWSVNKESDLFCLVMKGSGIIEIRKDNLENHYHVSEGESVLIGSNNNYRIFGRYLELAVSSAPSWKVEQYEVLSDDLV